MLAAEEGEVVGLDDCFAAVVVDVAMDVALEEDADVINPSEELLRLVVDAAAGFDAVEELLVDVIPIVVRTLGVPWNWSVLVPLRQSHPPPSMQQYESTPLLAHFLTPSPPAISSTVTMSVSKVHLPFPFLLFGR